MFKENIKIQKQIVIVKTIFSCDLYIYAFYEDKKGNKLHLKY